MKKIEHGYWTKLLLKEARDLLTNEIGLRATTSHTVPPKDSE